MDYNSLKQNTLWGAFIVVCILLGVFLSLHKSPARNSNENNEVSEELIPTPPSGPGEKMYQEGFKLLSQGELQKAKTVFESLRTQHGHESAQDDYDPEITFKEQANAALKKIDCSLQFETGGKNLSRSEEETVKKLIEAINKKDRHTLRNLIACDIMEGVPESEFGDLDPDSATDRLIGKYISDEERRRGDNYHVKVKTGDYQVITNGAKTVSVRIEPSPHAPQTHRVRAIIWGDVSQ